MKLQVAALVAALILSVGVGVACGTQEEPRPPQPTSPDLASATSLEELAVFYVKSGDDDQALPLYQEALGIREQLPDGDPLDIAKSHDKIADIYVRMGRYDQALTHYQRALAVREEAQIDDYLVDAASHNNVARVLFLSDAYDQALPHYQRVIEILEAAPQVDPLEVANSHDEIANNYIRMGRYDQALPHYQRALAFREEAPQVDSLEIAASHNNVARVHFLSDAYDQALPHYQRALEILEAAPQVDPLEVATSHEGEANVYFRTDAYDQALTHYRHALDTLEDAQVDDPLAIATYHENLGNVYFRIDVYDQAQTHYRSALEIREEVPNPDPLAVATSHDNLANVYFRTDVYDQAQRHYQLSLEIRERAQDTDPTARLVAFNNLALLHRHTGNYGQALSLLQSALDGIEDTQGPNHPATATALNNLAELYALIADFDRALPLFERALEIQEKAADPNPTATAVALNNLASLYFRMGEDERAVPFFQRALEIREDALGSNHPEIAPFLNNLAVLYRSKGNDEQALELYLRALAIREKDLGPNHPDTAMSLNNLGALYASVGDYDQALSLFQRSLGIWEKTLGPDHPNTAKSLNNLGILYENNGDYQQALDLFRRALATEDRAFNDVFAVASEQQKLLFAQANNGSYLATLSLIQRHFQNDNAAVRFGMELVLRRKGIVLDAQSRTQAALAANLKGEAFESWQRLNQLRGNLANLLLRGPGVQALTSHRQMIKDLEAAIDGEEIFLSRHSSQLARELTLRPVTLETLAQHLPQDGVLVEYVRIRDWVEEAQSWSNTTRYLAFVLTPDNRVDLADLGDADNIDAKIKQTLEDIGDPNYLEDLKTYDKKTSAGLSELYTRLLQPFKAVLGSHKRLIVSPDGEVNNVPFVALRNSKGEYLIETHTISYVSSGRDLLRDNVEIVSDIDILLVANPAFQDQSVFPKPPPPELASRASDFKETFIALPGTAAEAKRIAPLVQGSREVLLGREATESAVKGVMSPRVLHLATHGFFLKDKGLPLPTLLVRSSLVANSQERGLGGVANLPVPPDTELPPGAYLNPMVRSGLALAGANHAGLVTTGDDGILTALEVTGMNLQGTELVVLSACETAIGEVSTGEGVFGLRRAFTLAGAKNLVMSLWLVNDAATATQMEQFYKAFGSGQSAPESLRLAQLGTIGALRELTKERLGESIAPVKIWAPFIVQQSGE